MKVDQRSATAALGGAGCGESRSGSGRARISWTSPHLERSGPCSACACAEESQLADQTRPLYALSSHSSSVCSNLILSLIHRTWPEHAFSLSPPLRPSAFRHRHRDLLSHGQHQSAVPAGPQSPPIPQITLTVTLTASRSRPTVRGHHLANQLTHKIPSTITSNAFSRDHAEAESTGLWEPQNQVSKEY